MERKQKQKENVPLLRRSKRVKQWSQSTSNDQESGQEKNIDFRNWANESFTAPFIYLYIKRKEGNVMLPTSHVNFCFVLKKIQEIEIWMVEKVQCS